MTIPLPRSRQGNTFSQGNGPDDKQAINSGRLMTFSLLILTPLFFLGGPDWASGPLYKSVWNLGHILFFALLVLRIEPQRRLSGLPLWLVVTAAVMLVGALIEWAQGSVNRQSDWHDVLRDLIGAWLVLAWQPSGISTHSPSVKGNILAKGITLALLALELMLVVRVAYQQFQVQRLLPALYDFSETQPQQFWSGSASMETVLLETTAPLPSQPALKISLSTERYSGVSLDNLPSDWRGYQTLHLAIDSSSDKPIALVLRINDTRHDRGDNAFQDRFNQRLLLRPGSNEFDIDLAAVRTAPEGREMEMDDIRRLGLFAVLHPQPANIYLRDLHLELP